MSGLDASFLYLETPSMHMHVCAVGVFDPSTVDGGYSFENVKVMLRERLHLIPPFRRRLASVPFNLHHPVWIEDPNFDLDYHVRRIGCPGPGTEKELAEVAGDIASRQLDRKRPLWELWVVEGLQNGHIGLVAKMHHCTIDGVSGANMMVHLFDLEPEPDPVEQPKEGWEPERPPSDAELVGYSLLSRLKTPMRVAQIVPDTVRTVANIVQRRRSGEKGMMAPFTAPRTPFNVSITPHRKIAMAHLSLDDMKKVKDAFGVKVNDVVLALVSGALRRHLAEIDKVPEKSMIAVCPVSVHDEPHSDSVGVNRVSAIFSTLASDVDDPAERLMEIHRQNMGAKAEHKLVGAETLQNWAQFFGPTLFSLGARAYSGLRAADRHPVIHNLVISNVPGPRFPLYFAGAKLVSLYPLGPIFDGAALNVTVISYLDSVDVGFMACREVLPGLWDLAAAVPEAMAELVKAADERTGG